MITIYGASDDLIEVEGDVAEEFYANNDGDFLATSNGVLLSIHYGNDGLWTIRQLCGPAAEIHKASDEDTDYTDRCVIDAEVTWVIVGQAARRRGGHT